LVEQGTFNPKVAGSIPARPITVDDPAASRAMMIFDGFLFRSEAIAADAG